MQERIVIRRPILGHMVVLLGCAAFVAVGVLVLRDDIFVGVLGIALFGGGGLYYAVIQMWRPLVIIAPEGVTVPRVGVIPWENIEKFEIVEQRSTVAHKEKYIGVFVFDKTGVRGTGKRSQAMSRVLLNMRNPPAAGIHLGLSSFEIEEVLGILQEHHDAYWGVPGE